MTRTIDLPGFPGFYESRLSQIMDYELEQFAEYENEKQSCIEYHPEEYQPEELRVDVGGFAFDFVDYRAAEKEIAEDYVTAFNAAFEDLTGFKLNLAFESISSPRFYNFSTDRLFVVIPERSIRALWLMNKRDKFSAMGKIIEERCTSRSGFHSHYTNLPSEWLEKPLADYDHNELAVLLSGAIAARGGEDDLCGECCEYIEEASAGFDGYAIQNMNWPAFEERVTKEREELLDALPEDHPLRDEHKRPYRCPLTPDLFASAQA